MNFLILRKYLNQNPFIKNVAILFCGSALSQVITIIASPILTRVYKPEDFGLLAVFTAIVSTIAPGVSGKYEIAIMIPKSDKEGVGLLSISLWFTFGISLITFFLIFPFSKIILTKLNANGLKYLIFLIPVALFLTGLMTSMSYFANRYSDYANMSKAKIIKDSFVVLISVVLGFTAFNESGLLIGLISGLLLSSVFLLYIYNNHFTREFFCWDSSKIKLLKRYRDYPLYNASSSFLDGITVSMPVFILSYYYPSEIVGYYSLSVRMVLAPLSFISASVSQVNLKKVIDILNGSGDLKNYILKITKILSLFVVFPVIFLILFSPDVFAFVFGEKWRTAGFYIQILIPSIGVRFIATTLSTTLGATQNNHLGLIWKVTAFLISLLVFLLFAPKGDIYILLKAMTIMDIVLYLFYYFLIWKAAGRPKGTN